MCRMSSPRAATFVATRIGTRPERNCSSALSRAFWSRLPCSTATWWAALCSLWPWLRAPPLPRLRQEPEQELELVLRVRLHYHVLDVRFGAVSLVRREHLGVGEVLGLCRLHPGWGRGREAS